MLRNAWALDTKLTVFTGPVLDGKDPLYSCKRGRVSIQVPLKFWKVLVWSDKGKLRSLAFIADQLPTLKEHERSEGLLDADQLDLMEDFLTTVAKVEKITGFEFGEAVSAADIRFGKQDKRVESFDEIS